MKHCYGSLETIPGTFTQGDCGSGEPHGEHDFDPNILICVGAPAGFEADCGRPGPHGEHPMSEAPQVA
jgi:hypothetical protein